MKETTKRMLGACGMLERDKNMLRKRSVSLCKEMVVDELLIQMLQADGILTDSMAESILAETTSQKRNWRLLSLLPKRGPQAFSSFCTALRETEQEHLCAMLTEHRERCVDSPLPLPMQDTAKPKRARMQESLEMCLDADSPGISAVLPCSHDFYLSHFQQSYRMVSSPRGLALVISNVTFDPPAPTGLPNDLDRRVGGEVDEEVLRKVFTELDYTVTLYRNLSAQGMRACIEQFTRRPDHRVVDSCVVCLLSHGVEGAVYGSDGQLLELDWVFQSFDNAHCPQLQNKPKIFFVQACRGEEMDCGVDQTDGNERTESPGCEERDAARERESREREERQRERMKLPQRSDMICGFATLKGTAAMRNTKRGSWYIQELNAALRQRAKDTHLADILVQVNGRIKEREGYAPGTSYHRCKEMSEFTSSLCKNLFLFPKYCPQE